MDLKEFRTSYSYVINFITKYRDEVKYKNVYPGKDSHITHMLPIRAPKSKETLYDIIRDLDKDILPNLTNWNHPLFNAYLPCGNSYPAVLGEILSNGLGCMRFDWDECPGLIEMESIIIDMYGRLLNLPKKFLCEESGNVGGGTFVNSSSEGIYLTMLVAKNKALKNLANEKNTNPIENLSYLVCYASQQAHSCLEKAAKLQNVLLRKVDVDHETMAMMGDSLKELIEEDKKQGLYPFFVLVTMGTTGTGAIDNMADISLLLDRYPEIWYHVDGAYGGTALMLPEFRSLLPSLKRANSFNINPYKWTLTAIDGAVIYLSNKSEIDETSINKSSLSSSKRFQCLGLWFTMKMYGRSGLYNYIRNHRKLAQIMAKKIENHPDLVLMGKVYFGLVCFRVQGAQDESSYYTVELMNRLNNSKKIHLSPHEFNGFVMIRYCINYENANEKIIDIAWNMITKETREIINTPFMLFKSLKDPGLFFKHLPKGSKIPERKCLDFGDVVIDLQLSKVIADFITQKYKAEKPGAVSDLKGDQLPSEQDKSKEIVLRQPSSSRDEILKIFGEKFVSDSSIPQQTTLIRVAGGKEKDYSRSSSERAYELNETISSSKKKKRTVKIKKRGVGNTRSDASGRSIYENTESAKCIGTSNRKNWPSRFNKVNKRKTEPLHCPKQRYEKTPSGHAIPSVFTKPCSRRYNMITKTTPPPSCCRDRDDMPPPGKHETFHNVYKRPCTSRYHETMRRTPPPSCCRDRDDIPPPGKEETFHNVYKRPCTSRYHETMRRTTPPPSCCRDRDDIPPPGKEETFHNVYKRPCTSRYHENIRKTPLPSCCRDRDDIPPDEDERNFHNIYKRQCITKYHNNAKKKTPPTKRRVTKNQSKIYCTVADKPKSRQHNKSRKPGKRRSNCDVNIAQDVPTNNVSRKIKKTKSSRSIKNPSNSRYNKRIIGQQKSTTSFRSSRVVKKKSSRNLRGNQSHTIVENKTTFSRTSLRKVEKKKSSRSIRKNPSRFSQPTTIKQTKSTMSRRVEKKKSSRSIRKNPSNFEHTIKPEKLTRSRISQKVVKKKSTRSIRKNPSNFGHTIKQTKSTRSRISQKIEKKKSTHSIRKGPSSFEQTTTIDKQKSNMSRFNQRVEKKKSSRSIRKNPSTFVETIDMQPSKISRISQRIKKKKSSRSIRKNPSTLVETIDMQASKMSRVSQRIEKKKSSRSIRKNPSTFVETIDKQTSKMSRISQRVEKKKSSRSLKELVKKKSTSRFPNRRLVGKKLKPINSKYNTGRNRRTTGCVRQRLKRTKSGRSLRKDPNLYERMINYICSTGETKKSNRYIKNKNYPYNRGQSVRNTSCISQRLKRTRSLMGQSGLTASQARRRRLIAKNSSKYGMELTKSATSYCYSYGKTRPGQTVSRVSHRIRRDKSNRNIRRNMSNRSVRRHRSKYEMGMERSAISSRSHRNLRKTLSKHNHGQCRNTSSKYRGIGAKKSNRSLTNRRRSRHRIEQKKSNTSYNRRMIKKQKSNRSLREKLSRYNLGQSGRTTRCINRALPRNKSIRSIRRNISHRSLRRHKSNRSLKTGVSRSKYGERLKMSTTSRCKRMRRISNQSLKDGKPKEYWRTPTNSKYRNIGETKSNQNIRKGQGRFDAGQNENFTDCPSNRIRRNKSNRNIRKNMSNRSLRKGRSKYNYGQNEQVTGCVSRRLLKNKSNHNLRKGLSKYNYHQSGLSINRNLRRNKSNRSLKRNMSNRSLRKKRSRYGQTSVNNRFTSSYTKGMAKKKSNQSLARYNRLNRSLGKGLSGPSCTSRRLQRNKSNRNIRRNMSNRSLRKGRYNEQVTGCVSRRLLKNKSNHNLRKGLSKYNYGQSGLSINRNLRRNISNRSLRRNMSNRSLKRKRSRYGQTSVENRSTSSYTKRMIKKKSNRSLARYNRLNRSLRKGLSKYNSSQSELCTGCANRRLQRNKYNRDIRRNMSNRSLRKRQSKYNYGQSGPVTTCVSRRLLRNKSNRNIRKGLSKYNYDQSGLSTNRNIKRNKSNRNCRFDAGQNENTIGCINNQVRRNKSNRNIRRNMSNRSLRRRQSKYNYGQTGQVTGCVCRRLLKKKSNRSFSRMIRKNRSKRNLARNCSNRSVRKGLGTGCPSRRLLTNKSNRNLRRNKSNRSLRKKIVTEYWRNPNTSKYGIKKKRSTACCTSRRIEVKKSNRSLKRKRSRYGQNRSTTSCTKRRIKNKPNQSLARNRSNRSLARNRSNRSLRPRLSKNNFDQSGINTGCVSRILQKNKSIRSIGTNKSIRSIKGNKSIRNIKRNKSIRSIKRNKSNRSIKRNKSNRSIRINKSIRSIRTNKSNRSIRRNKSNRSLKKGLSRNIFGQSGINTGCVSRLQANKSIRSIRTNKSNRSIRRKKSIRSIKRNKSIRSIKRNKSIRSIKRNNSNRTLRKGLSRSIFGQSGINTGCVSRRLQANKSIRSIKRNMSNRSFARNMSNRRLRKGLSKSNFCQSGINTGHKSRRLRENTSQILNLVQLQPTISKYKIGQKRSTASCVSRKMELRKSNHSLKRKRSRSKYKNYQNISSTSCTGRNITKVKSGQRGISRRFWSKSKQTLRGIVSKFWGKPTTSQYRIHPQKSTTSCRNVLSQYRLGQSLKRVPEKCWTAATHNIFGPKLSATSFISQRRNKHKRKAKIYVDRKSKVEDKIPSKDYEKIVTIAVYKEAEYEISDKLIQRNKSSLNFRMRMSQNQSYSRNLRNRSPIDCEKSQYQRTRRNVCQPCGAFDCSNKTCGCDAGQRSICNRCGKRKRRKPKRVHDYRNEADESTMAINNYNMYDPDW